MCKVHFHLAASLAPQNGINTRARAICQRVGGAFYGYTRTSAAHRNSATKRNTHTQICKFINANSIITDAIITVPLCAPKPSNSAIHSVSARKQRCLECRYVFRLRCCAVNNRSRELFSFFSFFFFFCF